MALRVAWSPAAKSLRSSGGGKRADVAAGLKTLQAAIICSAGIMDYWNGSENVSGFNVGARVKGVEIGSVIDILMSLEEVEVETCLTCVAGSEIRTNSKLAKMTTY
jgi:hypothetical protein